MKRITVFLAIAILALAWTSGASALEWGMKELDTEKQAIAFHNEVKRGEYKVISTEKLKESLDKGEKMVLVDTMPYEDSFKKNHIPGAVQFEFPIEEMATLEGEKRASFEKLLGPDKNARLVFYCGFTKCTRSHNGAMWAKKLGYTDVYRHPGGIKAWLEADYPVQKEQ
jgi:rhodanese-related sulfurtransferase